MNYVTFETAKRLKAAGFPEPMPEVAFGQLWYYYDGRPYLLITETGGSPYFFIGPTANSGRFGDDQMRGMYFAPTATDVFQKISGPYWMEYHEWDKSFRIYGNAEAELVSSHENPAEAAAHAWLSIHEKTETI